MSMEIKKKLTFIIKNDFYVDICEEEYKIVNSSNNIKPSINFEEISINSEMELLSFELINEYLELK